MKTITAQAWKLGTVGIASLLAIALLFSSSPSQEAQAAVGQSTTCTIDITESTQQSLVNGAIAADVVTLVMDGGGTVGMSVGTVLTIGTEQVTVTAIASAVSATITRSTNNTTAIILADNTAVNFSAPTADNGLVTCVGTAGTDLNLKIKTSTANVTAGIYLENEMLAQAVTLLDMAGNAAADATSLTLDSTTGIIVGDVITAGTEKMYVTTITSGTVLVVTRGYNGTTAAVITNNDTISEFAHNSKSFADANMIKPTLNGLIATSLDTKAERDNVALSTFTPATATADAYYSTTVTVGTTSLAGGEAMIAICGPNSCPVYGADPDVSENLVHVLIRQAPIAYTDVDANGSYNSGDTLRTAITAQASVASLTTTGSAVFNVQDTKGQDLTGTAALTLSDAAFAAGIKWTNSGLQTISVTTTDTVGTPNETVGISGLPKTGNFRHTWDFTFTGTTGSITKTGGVIHRTDDKTATLTAVLLKAVSKGVSATTDATQTAAIPAVAAGAEDIYYVKVSALDSAGNKVQDTIKVKDDDSDGTDGLGTDITFEVFDATDNDAAVTSITTNASGVANFAVREAKVYLGTGTDPVAGTYNLTFYRSVDSTKSADVTIAVRSAAKTYSIASTSGEVDGALPTGAVGTYTVTAVDANGNIISAAASPTFIVTGLGTGATAGKSIPTSGALSVAQTTGGVISIVAPTVSGTGTIAVISSTGKIVASQALTFGTGSAAASATVSGTGCTASTVGSYTCVVTEGGTAAEVATASNAVSVWQSDANGVLQGYVVGTPDFVDTGLASTAAIAANSAVIVVR